MENPVQEIASVIDTLTKGTPQQQQDTLNTYFLSNASFIHPFCRVPSISKGSIPLARDVDSRWLILGIYRWYRTLSPRISLTVDSSVFDQRNRTLYVSIRQTFSICLRKDPRLNPDSWHRNISLMVGRRLR
ncbi:flavin-binding monooxygenase [Trichoderma arundinaceum]|uniref:Flavin-binding monooxygenase n=1 Tax=Trichoderma arundinaceum TaxID=490622 RepID=A0A395NKR8_TRIAR|nr:flavin-binding monooxygenase [Trichoderma arundinaceum]